MSHTLNQTMYKAFGLSIQSDIPLPELPQAEAVDLHGATHISVRYVDLDMTWPQHRPIPHNLICTPSQIMFKVPDLAVFAIENGNTIHVSPEPGADEDKIRLFILGSCMGAILLQRKILPLHGSAIVVDNKAYAFVGHSGHGKSTLASAFIQQGFCMLTDDVIAVTLNEQNVPMVSPAYPQQKLWQESLDSFGMNAGQFRPLFERETKFAVPVSSQFATRALPLAGIFELVKTDCEAPGIRPFDKLQRIPLLQRHTYRRSFLADSGLTQWHFSMTAKIAGCITAYQLWRPLNEPTVHQLMDMVLDAIEKK